MAKVDLTLGMKEDARAYLSELRRAVVKHGHTFYRAGHVRRLEPTEAPGTWRATVMDGGQPREISLQHEDGFGWEAVCDCDEETDCKHIAAVLMKLGESDPAPVPNATLAKRPGVTRLPATPLDILVQHLAAKQGRALNRSELEWASRVESVFRDCSFYSGLQAWAWQRMFGKQCRPLPEWAVGPLNALGVKDAIEFVELISVILEEQGAEVPPVFRRSVDLEQVRTRFAAVRRERALKQWREQVADWAREVPAMARSSLPSAPAVDVRIRLSEGRGTVELKGSAETPFVPAKRAILQTWFEQYAADLLPVVPDAVPLWDFLHRRYALELGRGPNLQEDELAQLVQLMVSIPGLCSRLVDATGESYRESIQRLQWHLKSVEDEQGPAYLLYLGRPDGSPLPPQFMAFSGRRTLYLFECQIWKGPPPLPDRSRVRLPHEQAGWLSSVRLPREVLASSEGVAFLSRLDPELLRQLSAKVNRCAFRLTIKAWLDDTLHSKSEILCLSLTAKSSDGRRRMVWDDQGWSRVATLEPAADELTVYDDSSLLLARTLLLGLSLRFDPALGSWTQRVGRDFAMEFANWVSGLPEDVDVELEGDLASLKREAIRGALRLEVSPDDLDWFDLRVVVGVEDVTLTPEELKALLNARGGFVRLAGKGWQRLQFDVSREDHEALANLGLATADFSAEPQRLHALQLAHHAAARFLPEAQLQSVQRRASELQASVTPPIPTRIQASLRHYQVEGFHFLAYLATNGFGGVLADDMGLGKTLQTLTWLAWLEQQPAHRGRPALVVCPKSVTDNWLTESAKFAPDYRVVRWSSGTVQDAMTGTGLLVVNYAQLRNLQTELSQVDWLAVILDEGQFIKNPQSQSATVACSLRARYRLVLTGTPIENRLLDLWSLMRFAMPGALGSRAQFLKSFGRDNDPFARRRLAARVRPFLIRRTKQQVALDLPEKVEEDLVCEMEGLQLTLYRAEFKRAQQILLRLKTDRDLDRERFNILTSLLRLRQICCHPALIDPNLAKESSAKMESLFDLLDPLMEEGHKVLVFSQFVTMLEVLAERMRSHHWPMFLLTGASEDRGALVEKFQQSEGSGVFLISLKAGGSGLNLSAASYVVLYDPWWNPAVETQAIDRTHRIGQVNKVMAYRLIVKDTIEQKIRRLQLTKKALAEDVLGEDRFSQSLTLDDLRFLFDAC